MLKSTKILRLFSSSKRLDNLRDIEKLTYKSLTQDQITAGISSLNLENWRVEKEASRNVIKRNLVFGDFNEAWSFMSNVAVAADMAEHHPEWFNVYNRVDITLSTHDCGGVSLKDLLLAKCIDDVSDRKSSVSENYKLDADISWVK